MSQQTTVSIPKHFEVIGKGKVSAFKVLGHGQRFMVCQRKGDVASGEEYELRVLLHEPNIEGDYPERILKALIEIVDYWDINDLGEEYTTHVTEEFIAITQTVLYVRVCVFRHEDYGPIKFTIAEFMEKLVKMVQNAWRKAAIKPSTS